MMKKILFASALLVSAHVALATPAPYLGGSAGITANTSSQGVGSYRGMPFSGFVGYGGVLDQNFYLAGEVTGTLATADVTNGGLLKTSYGYGISVLPGMMLSDHTLAFVRLGVLRTNFSNANSMLTGGQFGFGIQTTLTQNVDLRGEYDFIAYRSNSDFDHATYSSLSPRSDTFNLGLVYKFD